MRRPKSKKVETVVRDYACISCPSALRARWRGMPGESRQSVEEAADNDPVLAAGGWRKVEGGWKCPGCTGITGELGKALSRLKPGKAHIVFGKDGRIESAKNVGRRR